MPDVFLVFSRWWKRIVGITLLATITAAVTAALLPKKYVATATALPASSFASDKSAVFGTNIQQLYSALGTPDDLDPIIGTARLDTIYREAVTALNLAAHYRFSDENAGEHAAQRLKRRTTVSKSEWGELKIKVWDSNPTVAAQAANAVMQGVQQLHQHLQNQSNQVVLQKLKEATAVVPQQDTAKNGTIPLTANTTNSQAEIYNRLLSEYSLMVATAPPVLLVVEAARPPLYPDNTEKKVLVLATFFAALLFSFLLALYSEGKQQPS